MCLAPLTQHSYEEARPFLVGADCPTAGMCRYWLLHHLLPDIWFPPVLDHDEWSCSKQSCTNLCGDVAFHLSTPQGTASHPDRNQFASVNLTTGSPASRQKRWLAPGTKCQRWTVEMLAVCYLCVLTAFVPAKHLTLPQRVLRPWQT